MKKILINAKAIAVAAVLFGASTATNAQQVLLDNHYNRETKKTKDGKEINYHYLWDDKEDTGFSIFGDAFKRNGAKTLSVLAEAPTKANLKNADIYIIVDPDNTVDSPKPNYMDEKEAKEIAKWVRGGGVLLLMGNDEANADLKHFNILAKKFGLTFNSDLILHVKDDDHFDDGGLYTEGSSLFNKAKYIYIKNAASIATERTAMSLLKDKAGKTAIASAKYGKGMVLAVGDPWLYNEYTNGRLPKRFENDKAADDVARWLIENSRIKKRN
ncbi:hypothetical protein D3C87_337030 [compost metagenome]